MSDSQNDQPSALWQRQVFGVSKAQFLSAMVISFVALFWQDWVVAISVLSGGILVGLNSVLLARSVFGSSLAEGDGRGVLYRSAAIRFLLLILVLFGAALMGLELLAVAAGMFGAYVGGYLHVVRMASRAVGDSGSEC